MALHTSNPLTKTQMNLAPFSNWTSGFPYNTGDFVLYSTGIWKATRNNIADTPTSTSTSWTLELGGGGGGSLGPLTEYTLPIADSTSNTLGDSIVSQTTGEDYQLRVNGEFFSLSTAAIELWWQAKNLTSGGDTAIEYFSPVSMDFEVGNFTGLVQYDYGMGIHGPGQQNVDLFASDDAISYNRVGLFGPTTRNAFSPTIGTPSLGSTDLRWGNLFITATTSDPGVLGQVYSGALNALFISTGP